MLLRLLLLFTVVPLVELVLLLVLADHTGWEFALALVLATGIAGAALARWQGLRCLRRFHEQTAAGRIPTDPLMDGLMILVAAALLVTPGVLTDLAGFALLLPPVRSVLKRRVRRHWELRFHAFHPTGQPPFDTTHPTHDRIIDVRVSGPDEEENSE
ncbi:MAG: FxsA family protein [Thermoguttaceae bacterium]|jgi:UPF0716 protein FxsA|nr:FxsA family protein [Thermoguttaceae bacterium]